MSHLCFSGFDSGRKDVRGWKPAWARKNRVLLVECDRETIADGGGGGRGGGSGGSKRLGRVKDRKVSVMSYPADAPASVEVRYSEKCCLCKTDVAVGEWKKRDGGGGGGGKLVPAAHGRISIRRKSRYLGNLGKRGKEDDSKPAAKLISPLGIMLTKTGLGFSAHQLCLDYAFRKSSTKLLLLNPTFVPRL